MSVLVELLGASPGMAAIRDTIGRLLQHQAEARRLPPILIQGETGTGKGLLARSIHLAGPRSAGPFIDVNCAAIPETLLEAEMFGFERGAFTDAHQAKAGLFQAAHRGTMFLDEVGLLPAGLQSKLLKVIEDRAVRRLGSTRSEPVDVWVITATSVDLAAAQRAREFREDLYHRLAVLTVALPPLRERGQDIVLLAEHFLGRACADYDLPAKTLAPDARLALLTYAWPGNVRELSNVIERVALLTQGTVVTAPMLGLPAGAAAPRPAPAEPAREGAAVPLGAAVGQVERAHLIEALTQTDWNLSRAAARLGIPRNTLRYRIEKHGLRPPESTPTARRPGRPPAPARVAPLPAPAEGRESAEPGREHRRVTLLCAGVVPRSGEAASADEIRALEVLIAKVQSFGGRVEEVGGDGLVAAFGLDPVEDAPRRAALCAIAMQKAAERARRGDVERPAVVVGIHTEPLPVVHERGEPMVEPDALQAAKSTVDALMTPGEAGAIVVSPAAAVFLERRFDLVPVAATGPSPRETYRLVGPERIGPGRRLARFVGRQHELALLQSRLASAVRGQGQVVGIHGEAGIGKSRLLFEFRQSLAGARVAYLEGRCHSYGSAIPYLPVLDLVRMGCRITETDTPEVIAGKVRFGIQLLGMDPDEVAPYFLQLLGVKEGTDRLAGVSPEALHLRTVELLRQTSLRSGRRRPLVIAVEDLHWIDSASEAYVAGLSEHLAGVPVLLVVTYRPGYRPRWLEKSYATQIALQPLAPEEGRDIVQSVLRNRALPDPLARLILDKAEGNPFFLEELARVLSEHAEPGSVPVPDTIQEVLLARIDRLPDEPRRLLQTASVLGREFSRRLLAAIWPSPETLESQLGELVRPEFLFEQGGDAEQVYVFKHVLIQEVAYESLGDSRRRALHAAAGHALERMYAERLEEVYDRLAYHYSRAQEAGKAVAYLARLADKAARGYAHTEAVTALREALAHVERLPAEDRDRRHLELTLRQVRSLSFLGRFQEMLELLLGEHDRVTRLAAPGLAGPYHFWLAHTHSYLGDQDRAAEHARRAIDEAGRAGDDATMGRAYLLLAQESSWSGQPREGVEQGRRAVDLLERAGDRWWLGLAHWIVGINHIATGRFDRALEAEERARVTGEAIGDPRIQSYATWTTGWIHALRGEAEPAIAACQRGLDLSPDPVNSAIAQGHLGYAYLEHGDLARATALLEQSVAQMRQFGFRRLHGRFAAFLGEARLQAGDVGAARELVAEGLAITREAKYWYGVGWAELALGRIDLARGALAEAASHLQAALGTFGSIQAEFMAARAHLVLAEVAHAQGDSKAVERELAEAHRAFASLGVERYAARARAAAERLGVVLAASDAPI